MDVYISLGNNKNDLKAIVDPVKKAFAHHLIKLFNPKLSEHSKMLRESSENLTKFDRQSTQRQSFLIQTISRFHYIEKSAFVFDKNTYSNKIVQDSFEALAKYVQFSFADKIAEEISEKVMQLFKLTEPAVQETDQKRLVLGTAGTLLEVDYKIVYVQLDESTKWKYWSSFSKDPLNKRNKKNQIHFVAILFSISIVYVPLSEQQDALITNSQLAFTKKQLGFIETKRKLMKFIDSKRSNDLFLAFDKFQLIQLGDFKKYWKKYLTKQALNVGYFNSMRQYISGSSSVFAIGVGQSIDTSSSPLQIYSGIVQPIINILTPINASILPDFLSQIARKTSQIQKNILKQAINLDQALILDSQFMPHNEQGQKQNMTVQKEVMLEQLEQKFHLEVSMQGKDKSYQLQGVRIDQLIQSVQSRVGKIQVVKSQNNDLFKIEHYTGILYDEQTVISNFNILGASSIKFYLKDKYYQINIEDDRTTGTILKVRKKVVIEASQYSFSLNFMQDYSSQFCLHELLVNKNIYMAGVRFDSKKDMHKNAELQVSKIIHSFRKQFFQLFQKKPGFQGAPIFFVEEAKKQCKIIAFCENQNNFGSLFRSRSQQIEENSDNKGQSLLDFSTRFLKKEAYTQIIPKAKEKIEEKKFRIIDNNDKGEPLREQILSKSIKGSSPIELIGIFKMVCHEGTKYGIALLCTNSYFIALASSVYFDGSGYIHIRKRHVEEQLQEENFQGFNLEDCHLYDYLEIQNIIIIPGNQEYVYLEVKRNQSQKLRTERKINRNSLECLLDSRKIGGFLLELDFRNTSETSIIHFDIHHITNDFRTILAEIQKEYPEKQGIMFAFQKDNPNIQYFLGLYSPKSPLGNFPLPDIGQQIRQTEEKIVITMDQNGDLIELQKMEEVIEKQQYQAVGYFKYRTDPLGFGSGVLIGSKNNAANKKAKKILTCAHNFYSIEKGKLLDDTRNLNAVTFCYYKRSLLKFCQLSLKKVTIHPTYKKIINRRIKEPDSLDPLLQLSPAYDIAIVQLKESVCIQNIFHLELPIELSQQLAADLQIFRRDNILTEKFIAQVELAGFPQEEISLGIVHGKMYKQNVESHKGEIFSVDPLFFFNVVPLGHFFESPLMINHKLSTLPGQSGSPIFNKQTRMVVGVHVAALKDQRIPNSQYTFQNIGSFVYYPSVYNFLKREIEQS